jgi:hypothetical protein
MDTHSVQDLTVPKLATEALRCGLAAVECCQR